MHGRQWWRQQLLSHCSHGALDDLVVVAEGALEHLVQLRILLHHDLLRALLSATHDAAGPENLGSVFSWFAAVSRSLSLRFAWCVLS